MTNEVEQLVLSSVEINNELSYAENKAYMLYEEIWKFLMNVKDDDFDLIRIAFSYQKDDKSCYIYRTPGITYTKICDSSFSKWNNYYHGCTHSYLNLLFNTDIDMHLFFKLIAIDGFFYQYLDDINPALVCIDIKKEQIEQKINEILIKNKILKKVG